MEHGNTHGYAVVEVVAAEVGDFDVWGVLVAAIEVADLVGGAEVRAPPPDTHGSDSEEGEENDI